MYLILLLLLLPFQILIMKYLISAALMEKALSGDSEACSRVGEVIKAREGSAKVRTLTVSDMCRVLTGISRTWGISKAAMRGCSVSVDVNAQSFPRAYRYIPESTIFSATFTSSGWAITDINRGPCRSPGVGVRAELTPSAKASILSRMLAFSC